MVKKEASIERFNTRDLLLLSQLVEQHGEAAMDQIHEEFINHPVFLLSHNEMNNDQLRPTPRQLQDIFHELQAQHPDNTIVQLCEVLYSKRIAELEDAIKDHYQAFTKQLKIVEQGS